MSLVTVSDLHLQFGGKTLFEAGALTINPGEKIGLLGPNGAGKSTLLKVLAKQLAPDSGQMVFRKNLSLGFLTQDLETPTDRSALESMLSAVPAKAQLEAQIASAEQSLLESAEPEGQMEWALVLAQLHERQAHFEQAYGKHRAEAILNGLGFEKAQREVPLGQLSGGWRMRAALASLLFQNPDLLLLDEPTNHLDLPSLAWFDQFLKRTGQAAVMVSHDRGFLNRHIDKVVSLEPEGLKTYRGNYDAYLQLREAELEQLQLQAERQASKRAHLESFIARFKAKASKARQAQSRVKQLEKMEAVQVIQGRNTAAIAFQSVPPSGREVLAIRNLSKAFGPRTVYQKASAQLLRGWRVAICGPNGIGKSTLLKMLAQEVAPDEGEFAWGHQVQVGYFAQHHAEVLDGRLSVLESVREVAPERSDASLRSTLGALLFSNDEVFKPVSVLSGGERARVALARLLVRPTNVLLMDEPTNHLDLDTCEVLAEALAEYPGTILLVSHHESFLKQVATHIWEIQQGGLVPYPGGFEDYLAHLGARPEGGEEGEEGGRSESEAKRQKRAEAEARQALSKRLGPVKKRIEKLEGDIAACEAELAAIETALGSAEVAENPKKLRENATQHGILSAKLQQLMAEWEEAQLAL